MLLSHATHVYCKGHTSISFISKVYNGIYMKKLHGIIPCDKQVWLILNNTKTRGDGCRIELCLQCCVVWKWLAL